MRPDQNEAAAGGAADPAGLTEKNPPAAEPWQPQGLAPVGADGAPPPLVGDQHLDPTTSAFEEHIDEEKAERRRVLIERLEETRPLIDAIRDAVIDEVRPQLDRIEQSLRSLRAHLT